ncbi:MAG: sensor histidine kinase [Acutalibacteraceae bacterium]
MSFFRDRQIRWYAIFLVLFSVLLLGINLMFSNSQIDSVKEIYTMQNEAIISSLLEQGVPKEVAASALRSDTVSEDGKQLLRELGMDRQSRVQSIPGLIRFQQSVFSQAVILSIVLILLLVTGTAVFFWYRKRLYLQANKVISQYIDGDFSNHLPQNSEGAIFQLFSSVEQLATMLKSKNETEHKSKEFLKNTISDISHQLKTPLAALTMYQEIIAGEPENAETVKEFSAKMGSSLNRMNQLIQSMLKITRLDSGNIVFEKSRCSVSNLIAHSIRELTTRAENENKQIIVEKSPDEQLTCDMEWTGEAIGNIVKNALDHTVSGGVIHISWERTPAMVRISIADNGDGIAEEDIHHIFKRFYRSRHTLETPGIGLGLPLAKSIVEGQGGFLAVQSKLHRGTTFTLSFLTES